jgi:hypothetical protein
MMRKSTRTRSLYMHNAGFARTLKQEDRLPIATWRLHPKDIGHPQHIHTSLHSTQNISLRCPVAPRAKDQVVVHRDVSQDLFQKGAQDENYESTALDWGRAAHRGARIERMWRRQWGK